MWELDHKRRLSAEELMLLNCGVGEGSWEPLGLQRDQSSQSQRNQPCIFIGRTDAQALILWPSDAKSRFIGKDPDSGKYWVQVEKRVTDDEMVGWHHLLNGHELSKPREIVKDKGAWCAAVQGITKIRHNLATEQQQMNHQCQRNLNVFPYIFLMYILFSSVWILIFKDVSIPFAKLGWHFLLTVTYTIATKDAYTKS